jgi:hypothetical protein
MVACGGKTGSTGGIELRLTRSDGNASANCSTSSDVGRRASTDDDAELEVWANALLGPGTGGPSANGPRSGWAGST